MKRSLSLKRETLVELTSADLGSVVAAAVVSGTTCPYQECLSNAGLCDLTAQPRCF